MQAELHEARAVAQHLRAGEGAWQEQRLVAEAAQEEAVAVAARQKADAEVARARAVSELEDLLSYETAARELDRYEVASCYPRLSLVLDGRSNWPHLLQLRAILATARWRRWRVSSRPRMRRLTR